MHVRTELAATGCFRKHVDSVQGADLLLWIVQAVDLLRWQFANVSDAVRAGGCRSELGLTVRSWAGLGRGAGCSADP